MNRVIYACEFPDGHAYVGLTCDPELRSANHGRTKKYNSSVVALHKNDTGLDFEFKILTDFISEEEARIAEGEWMKMYEGIGWYLLNRATAGGIGGRSHKFDVWQIECDAVTGNYFDSYEFDTFNMLDDVYCRPSYCAEEMSKIIDCCNEYIFLGYRATRVSREMYDRWYVFGFVLEECVVLRRLLFFGVITVLMHSNLSYKTVGKKLKKEMETIRFLLKPQVLYDLIGVSGQEELEELLNAETIEQSLTLEQRKSVKVFMKRIRNSVYTVKDYIDALMDDHKDEEFVLTGFKDYRYKEKGSKW